MNRKNISSTLHTRLMVAILLLAFALRLSGLADHNIWWDEGIGVWLARMPVLESIRWTGGDVHPPLYYVLLRGWHLLAGEGEFVLRFPSVLFSFLTIPLIYRLGKSLTLGRRNTETISSSPPLPGSLALLLPLLAVIFLTLSRFAVIWAQEIRMYALSAMFATGVLWASIWMWRKGGWRAWLTYVLTTLGSLYTLYLTVTVPMVANLGFLVVWWKQKRPNKLFVNWLTAQLTVTVLYIPWLAYTLPRMHSWSSDSAFSPGFFVKLYTTMLAVGSPLDLEAYLPLTITVFAVLILGLIFLLMNKRTSAQDGAITMLLSGLLLPALVVYVISLPFFSFYYSRPLVPRYLLPLSACFYALLAWGIQALGTARVKVIERFWTRGQRWLALAATLLVIFTLVSGLRSFYPGRARRDDYVSIALALEAHRQPNDAVLLYVDRDWPIFVAHYAGERDAVPYGMALDDAATDALLSPIWDAADGVWLVTTPEALQTDPQQTIPSWLQAHAKVRHTFVAGENSLTFYAHTEARADAVFQIAPNFEPPTNIQREIGMGGVLQGATLPLSRYRTGGTVHLALYWATLPKEDVRIGIFGLETREFPISDVLPNNSSGTTRQMVDIPLTPDLPGGRYRVKVRADNGDWVDVGDFVLLRSAAGAEIALDDIAYPVDYQLGEHIHLIGYDLPQRTATPGGAVELTLYWRTEAAIPVRYKVFTHLLGEVYNANSDNFLWGQQDNEPGGGQALTTLWTPGTVIEDTYRIPVDPSAPPGTYQIEIGMYGLVDVARLPVFDANGAPTGDAIFLAEIEIQSP